MQIKDKKGLIPHDWILLDTCSTDDVINNRNLVDGITSCGENEKLKIYANGGELTYNEKGCFKYLPLCVHFNPSSIANVLSLKQVDDMPGFHLEMNTQVEPGITLIKGEARIQFMHSRNGLYYCSIGDMNDFHASIMNRNTCDIIIFKSNILFRL